MIDIEELRRRRFRNWRQDGERKVENPEQASAFIQEVGITTLYAASPEFPSLYQAHMGDPNPPNFASWDSPSGYVYTWRWELGRPHVAFYGVVVAKKPTWVAFDRLPTVLGALMERRTPKQLYAAGELSADAYRLAQAYEGTGGLLSTKELRARGGFEKGKESRAAYLKAVDELDARLWLAKRCGMEDGGDEMSHALVTAHYSDAASAAMKLDPVEALADLLAEVIRHSVYLDPKPISRHLRIRAQTFDASLLHLEDKGVAHRQIIGNRTLYIPPNC
ncbi:hypothetical protein [Fimbriimonas ginsengisoli]|uniref:Uncharacterized protein n=1 Tax=Fimbriimonas ginsengisoli Gsoil 348 TaxID=661478 RepID=A0A068NW84_FIMGI|nr:hypothetical protein [Fimbriimonas ginsengisoli]AIE85869.1 hypothetical protein OP10G_2501 [Fimbriimonas ginsengisoli Gsoil 348]